MTLRCAQDGGKDDGAPNDGPECFAHDDKMRHYGVLIKRSRHGKILIYNRFSCVSLRLKPPDMNALSFDFEACRPAFANNPIANIKSTS